MLIISLINYTERETSFFTFMTSLISLINCYEFHILLSSLFTLHFYDFSNIFPFGVGHRLGIAKA